MLKNIGRNHTVIKILFIIFLIADIAYTFHVNYVSMMLDGDMSAQILPADAYQKVFSDPFGLSALFHQEHYPATNRIFIHFLIKSYFSSVPFALQYFFDPIQSIFISVALCRTFFQIMLIYLLAVYGSGSFSVWNKKFLISAVIVTPFFQINGFSEEMELTFNSITYTFFYTLPLILIAIYFLPFYFRYILREDIRFNTLLHANLLFILLMICLGGPLGAPCMLIGCGLILIFLFFRNFKKSSGPLLRRGWNAYMGIEKNVLMHFTMATIIAAYSIYIGTFNSENDLIILPLIERYKQLPQGLWRILFMKFGSGFLACLLILYVFFLIKKKKISESRIHLIKIAGIFCLFFILTLPLGGYRFYRPMIVRADTFIPVTFVIILSYLIGAMLMLENVKGRSKNFLIILYICIAAIYMNADRNNKLNNNSQREALKKIAESDQEIVQVQESSLLFWGPTTDYSISDMNGRLIQFWNISKEKKLYFSK